MWTTTEPYLGIINAYLPTMRPFLVAIFPECEPIHLVLYGKGVTRGTVSHTSNKKAHKNRISQIAELESAEELQAVAGDGITVQRHWCIQKHESENQQQGLGTD